MKKLFVLFICCVAVVFFASCCYKKSESSEPNVANSVSDMTDIAGNNTDINAKENTENYKDKKTKTEKENIFITNYGDGCRPENGQSTSDEENTAVSTSSVNETGNAPNNESDDGSSSDIGSSGNESVSNDTPKESVSWTKDY